jgi:hypothetical protein
MEGTRTATECITDCRRATTEGTGTASEGTTDDTSTALKRVHFRRL